MKKQNKAKLKEEITLKISERLTELVAAAASYGALSHELYTDDRIKDLRDRGLKRLTDAAKDYHSVLTAAMVLS
jgi:hypothetical protein